MNACPQITGDAQGLAVFQKQTAYLCAKDKARKAFLLYSGVLYLAGWHVKKS